MPRIKEVCAVVKMVKTGLKQGVAFRGYGWPAGSGRPLTAV